MLVAYRPACAIARRLSSTVLGYSRFSSGSAAYIVTYSLHDRRGRDNIERLY